MKTKISVLVLVAVSLFLAVRCTPSSVAGNGTQTGNPAMIGILYQPDGHTPAVNAAVQFIHSENVPGLTSKKATAIAYSTVTNSSGQYSADGHGLSHCFKRGAGTR